MSHAVKFIKETETAYTIGGYGVVWGGRDLLGDYFTKETDFWMDRITYTPPVLYEHGHDEGTKKAVLGQVITTKMDDDGLWIEAQLEKSREYVEAVMELVKKGVLGWSSGAVAHLVERTKSGHITSWAIAEFSLTPDPAEPRTLGVADLSDVEDEPAVKSMLDAVKALPTGPTPIYGSDFGYPDGSYEARSTMLANLARAAIRLGGNYDYSYGWCVATFPEYFVFQHEDGDTFRIAYSMGDDGKPVLAEWQEVEPAYVPKNTSDMDIEAAPVTLTAARFAEYAAALLERTKDLQQRRAAEGRQLSARNVETIDYVVNQIKTVAFELDELTAAESEPGTKDQATDSVRLKVAIAAAHNRMLAS